MPGLLRSPPPTALLMIRVEFVIEADAAAGVLLRGDAAPFN